MTAGRISLLLVGILPVARLASAQKPPGQNVRVKVEVSSVVLRGDTTGVSSTVANLATSQEELFTFLVDAPSGVLRIDSPNPIRSWSASRDFGGEPTAYWSILALLTPGATTPPLYFESVGLPGIVTYWAGGYFPLPGGEGDEPSPDAPSRDPKITEMINGKTVGVVPWPTERTPKVLIARLRTLTQKSCAGSLRWITSPSLCAKLLSDLTRAEENRAAGQTAKAKSFMTAYTTLLRGKTAGSFATGVRNPGYWLLKPNADIIVSKL